MGDEDVGAELDRTGDRGPCRVEREDHAGDLALRIAREKTDAVPVLGPLGGEALARSRARRRRRLLGSQL